jgi:cell division protein FtsI (penicillin-binding protein 3)
MVILCFLLLGKNHLYSNNWGKYWVGMSNSLQIITIIIAEGTICGEDGNMLSTSVPVFDIYVDLPPDGLRKSKTF